MWRRRREEPAAVEQGGRRDEVPERWRAALLECDRLHGELGRLVEAAPPGALSDRLTAIRVGVTESIEGAAAAARRAGEVQRLAVTVDVAGITDAYKRARREADAAAQRGQVPEQLEATVASLARQHGTAHRLLNAADETDERLEAVRTRLTEIVLSAGELTLRGSAGAGEAAEAQAAALAADVRSLREAFAELD